MILHKKFKEAFAIEEIRWYFGIILASTVVIAVMVTDMYSGFGEAFQQAAFQVGSIITTTGYATTDFNLWPEIPRTILLLLMLVGACAGSTGGGIKVSRLVILVKTIGKELQTLIHPRSVKKLKMDGHPIDHEVIRSTNVFLIAYVLIFAFSVLLIAIDDYDLITNFSAVAATFNNIGPYPELFCIFKLFHIGADLRYACRKTGDLPHPAALRKRYLEKILKYQALCFCASLSLQIKAHGTVLFNIVKQNSPWAFLFSSILLFFFYLTSISKNSGYRQETIRSRIQCEIQKQVLPKTWLQPCIEKTAKVRLPGSALLNPPIFRKQP